MVILISYFAYKFSKELIASVKQLSQTISEYAEEKRKIFGHYSEQARQYSYDTFENARMTYENAKKAYFSQEPPEIKPFDHVEKPKEVPSQQITPPIAPHHNPRGVDNRV
uniref:Uncharacterized protein n=1 Tax=Ditylenchus dipsaci TaxID=166011 RepID=A0A915EG58_9BILA